MQTDGGELIKLTHKGNRLLVKGRYDSPQRQFWETNPTANMTPIDLGTVETLKILLLQSIVI